MSGTFGYQMDNGQEFQAQNDIFSLGHILFDLCYQSEKTRVQDHLCLSQKKFPQRFDPALNLEMRVIDLIVIKKAITSISTLRKSIAFQ